MVNQLRYHMLLIWTTQSVKVLLVDVNNKSIFKKSFTYG